VSLLDGWLITVTNDGEKLIYRIMGGEPRLVEAWGVNPLAELEPGYYDLDLRPVPEDEAPRR
jgi:hypothetical protein